MIIIIFILKYVVFKFLFEHIIFWIIQNIPLIYILDVQQS